MRKLIFWALAYFGALSIAQAACVTTPLAGAGPIISGHLAFESVIDDYDSYISIYDFETKSIQTVQGNLPDNSQFNPLNPSFSPNGKWIVFTARISYQQIRHLYAWSLKMARLVDLTPDATTNQEDPKFSFDGKYIVYKDNGSIAIAPVTFNNTSIALGTETVLAVGVRGKRSEGSAPTLSKHDNYLYYYRGNSNNPASTAPLQLAWLRIDPSTLEVNKRTIIANPANRVLYYPNLRSDGLLFFVQTGLGVTDQVYTTSSISDHLVMQATASPSNFCSGDNSDPAPAGTDYIFSNDAGGGYQLFVADLSGNVWSFDGTDPKINQSGNSLKGAAYSPY